MRCLVLLVCLSLATPARADDGSRHLVYAEVLGKAGPYGIGYEYAVMPWIAFGAAISYAVIGDERLTTTAPYVHVPLLGHRRNRMFTELGAIAAHRHIPSPVPDWAGSTHTGTAAFLSLGYEHAAKHLVIRASGSVVAGDGGLGPMIGLSFGARP
jgi:hypothetical protein